MKSWAKRALDACSHDGKCRRVPGSSRKGIIWAQFEDLRQTLGMPIQMWPGDADDKVSYEWYIQTPRGVACIYDYWWNVDGEWSIGATDPRVCRWVRRYLLALGCKLYDFGGDKWKMTKEDLAIFKSFPRINRPKKQTA